MPSLLISKIQTPPLPLHTVRRTPLIDLLEQVLPHYKLLHITTPAGYGKTTLLAQWARSSNYLAAWLTLEEDDNDRERFLRYLVAAWEVVQPDIKDSLLGTLMGGAAPDIDAVLSAFIRAAADLPDHLALVLDDYHLIRDPSIHEAVTFLIDHLPAKFHLVVAGRGEPPLPLARYLAHGVMMELGVRDLRFAAEQTEAFLNQKMELDLSPEISQQLHTQLEGWIAGVQLVGISIKRGLISASEPVVSGQQRFIADYLNEDVLSDLPAETRQFLLQTSILDRLCGSLCDAVLERSGGQAMLEMVEAQDLFILPLDDRREWFRYHQLFADFLQEKLRQGSSTAVTSLHRKAAAWYIVHDMPERAFHHALEGDDAALVLQVLEENIQSMLMGGQLKHVKQWLDLLPEAWSFNYPEIDLLRTGYYLFSGQVESSVRIVDSIEERLAALEGADKRSQLARIGAMRCSIACFKDDLAKAELFANQALEDLPGEDHLFRAILYLSLGDTYRRHGQWQKAKNCYLEMLDFIDKPAFRLQSAHVFGALADLNLRQGRLREAADYWQRALVVIRERKNWGRLPMPFIGWVYIRTAELLYEQNELQEAEEHLNAGLERAELGGDIRAMIAGYLIGGRLKLTEADIEGALAYLEMVRPMVERSSFWHWICVFERLQLELWLAEERTRRAIVWAEEVLSHGVLEQRPESEMAQLAVARALMVKGDGAALQQALALVEQLHAEAAAEGRIAIQIEALALQALALVQCGETAKGMAALERALRLAEPEGYKRLFTDLGLPMARLLQEAHARQVMPDYTASLLATFGGIITPETRTPRALPEPLTDREEEVLKLLAAGLTNQEIGEELVISAGTVKKHASNIYGKLGVSSRTEAAARARELNLLD